MKARRPYIRIASKEQPTLKQLKHPIEVGTRYYEKGHAKHLSYNDILSQFPDEWVPVQKYLPLRHDLVTIEVATGLKKKGWYCGGGAWEGYRIESDDIPICWKKRKDEY